MSEKVPYNKLLALWLLKISELTTYQFMKPEKFQIPKGFKLVTELKAKAKNRWEKFGFILESLNSDSIVIAFRGSDSLQDWEVDLEEGQVPFHGGYVHSGFLSIYESCKDQIIKAYKNDIKNTNDKTLFITGHSLGAGLATLHALDVELSDIKFKDIVMYNFASPRVGNVHFRNIYNSHINESVRFVNNDDEIPKLPKRIVRRKGVTWNYLHVKSSVSFTLKDPVPGWIYNHSFQAYQKGIEQLDDSR